MDRLVPWELALQAQGQVALLPDQGVAGQAGLLVPEVAVGVQVGEEVRLAAEPVAGLALTVTSSTTPSPVTFLRNSGVGWPWNSVISRPASVNDEAGRPGRAW